MKDRERQREGREKENDRQTDKQEERQRKRDRFRKHRAVHVERGGKAQKLYQKHAKHTVLSYQTVYPNNAICTFATDRLLVNFGLFLVSKTTKGAHEKAVTHPTIPV